MTALSTHHIIYRFVKLLTLNHSTHSISKVCLHLTIPFFTLENPTPYYIPPYNKYSGKKRKLMLMPCKEENIFFPDEELFHHYKGGNYLQIPGR